MEHNLLKCQPNILYRKEKTKYLCSWSFKRLFNPFLYLYVLVVASEVLHLIFIGIVVMPNAVQNISIATCPLEKLCSKLLKIVKCCPKQMGLGWSLNTSIHKSFTKKDEKYRKKCFYWKETILSPVSVSCAIQWL